MANRITGMYSGLDTESLIESLVEAKSTKVTTLNKEKTKLEWKQEKWTDLNKKVKSLFSGTVSNLRWASTYKKKTTSVSNSSAVSVITGDGAMNSVQNLSIKKLAKSGYLTGDEVSTSDGSSADGTTALSKLTFNGESVSANGSFDVSVDGKTTTISFDESTSIDSIVNQLKEAGVSANFDSKNSRLFIGASSSGVDADFTITANDANGMKALSSLGINAAPSDAASAKYAETAAMESYLQYDSNGDFDAEATISNIQTDVSSDAYKKLMSLAKDSYQTEVDAQKKIVDDLKAVDTSEMDETAKAEHEAKLAEENTKLEEMNTNLSAGTYSSAAMTEAVNTLKDQIDFAKTAANDASQYNSGAVRIYGENAEIELNGATFTSNSNNLTVNGLTFTLNAVADDITVTTQDDTDGVYDVIKNFIKEYNSLINEIDSLYNADSTTLEPLTDEEKEAVSESEAEKLENKVKDSLLRKDTTLGSLFDGLKNTMSAGITVNGKTMFLSDFGIETLGYFNAADGERNAYHIDGDEDDDETSGNTDKLKTMIANDPDTVVSFFSELGKNLYSKLDSLSAASEYSTYGSFFDDKKIKSDLSSYETKISDAEEKLNDYEDKYYDKFSAMEVALSKLESSSSYISSLFG